MRPLLIAAALIFPCAHALADDAALIGVWNAIDQPGKTMEIRADGVFRYVYDPSPPRTVLQIQWRTGWFGKFVLSMANGGNAHTCYYKLDGDDLTIDDGSGRSCIDTAPVKMAQRFKLAK